MDPKAGGVRSRVEVGVRGGCEELRLNRGHAPLKDYSREASAFGGLAGDPEPLAARRGGRQDVEDVRQALPQRRQLQLRGRDVLRLAGEPRQRA